MGDLYSYLNNENYLQSSLLFTVSKGEKIQAGFVLAQRVLLNCCFHLVLQFHFHKIERTWKWVKLQVSEWYWMFEDIHTLTIFDYIFNYQNLSCNITAGIFRKIVCNVNSVLKL